MVSLHIPERLISTKIKKIRSCQKRLSIIQDSLKEAASLPPRGDADSAVVAQAEDVSVWRLRVLRVL